MTARNITALSPLADALLASWFGTERFTPEVSKLLANADADELLAAASEIPASQPDLFTNYARQLATDETFRVNTLSSHMSATWTPAISHQEAWTIVALDEEAAKAKIPLMDVVTAHNRASQPRRTS